ncbi:MAG: type II secretion system GspH family protein [Azoarcus sp.]|jgi:prepilin-type N-terminal cleavage/methylation domain-containing protein|nr:type II secretion system GspH family protein [Azoarcus sp.]
MRTAPPSVAGFTLAELLVVVAVLSATALAAFGLVSEDRAQVRIDDTRNRLAVLRRAVIGPEAPVYGGEMRLAGYVADNGRLPRNLGELLGAAEEDYLLRKGVTPKLAAKVDAKCFQQMDGGDDDEDKDKAVELGNAARVLKGHRGNYLASAARGGEFRDGWGNVGSVEAEGSSEDSGEKNSEADNFGWHWDETADGLTITSFGADNMLDGAPPPDLEAEVDQTMRIDDADWRVPLDGWMVTIRNANAAVSETVGSGTGESDADEADSGESGPGGAGTGSASAGSAFTGDIDPGKFDSSISSFNKLGLVLLVFENAGASGRWRQYRSGPPDCGGNNDPDAVLKPGEFCVFRFVADDDGKIQCGGAGNSTDAKVPLGRHVLLLAIDNTDSMTLPEEKYRFVTQVDFFPGALQPNLVWEVR